jgi:hypothetical protein
MPAGGGGGRIKLGVTEAESNWVEPAARGRRGLTVASEISAPPRQGKSWSRPWVGGGDQGDLSWSLFFFFSVVRSVRGRFASRRPSGFTSVGPVLDADIFFIWPRWAVASFRPRKLQRHHMSGPR